MKIVKILKIGRKKMKLKWICPICQHMVFVIKPEEKDIVRYFAAIINHLTMHVQQIVAVI